MNSFGSSLILQLSAAPESFPFASKFLPVSNGMKSLTLGLAEAPPAPVKDCRDRADSGSSMASTLSSPSPPSPTLSTFSATSSTSYRGSIKRSAKPSNGWFPVTTPKSQYLETRNVADCEDEAFPGPLPVSVSHAEIWAYDGEIHIRDLESAFGTFVNGRRVNGRDGVELRNGDIISLGAPIQRNASTPAYVTDDQLKPIIAKVTLIGAALSRP